MLAGEPCSVLQLSLQCNNLPNLDTLSKSDPLVVVYELQHGTNQYKEIGRTERIKNDLNPRFVKKFDVKYYFERVQKFTFVVYDSDGSEFNLEDDDSIGRVECALNEIMGSRGQRLSRDISNPNHKSRKNGVMIISAEEMASSENFDFAIHIGAHNVDKKDLFGKSDPFLCIYKEQGGMKTLVHKTEVVKNNLSPLWVPFTISGFSLCSNDMNKKLTFECFDWDSDGTHDFIGAFESTPAELQSKKKFALINPKKTSKKDYKHSGEIEFHQFEKQPIPTFVEFLKGGCQISFMVAIDFTGSNGNPNQPTSLHYRNPAGPNEYMQAIYAAGAVLEPYDADRQFPVFGFGAKLPNGTVSHDFNVNFNENDPTVFGVPGIINAYITSLNHVELYGPTNFAPIIRKATRLATSSPPSELKYSVLLILTDGEITDMDATIDAIIDASTQPLSILIVGVGGADFDMMEKLDGDDGALRSGSRRAQRDIVQFVPFRKSAKSPEALAEQLLAEIPGQLLSYMKMHRLKPGKPTA